MSEDQGESSSAPSRRRSSKRETVPTSAAAAGSASSRPKGRRGPSRSSCAECRRLKLKCDTNVPCNQCVKRGYVHLCPDGTQTTGQGHRIFWNTTSDLRVKAGIYVDRIRQLEDALRAAHAVSSHETHTLLTEELLRVKDDTGSGPTREGTQDSVDSSDITADVEERKPDISALEHFGSLNISDSGSSKFFGHGANSWWFMHNEEHGGDDEDATVSSLFQHLPQEILAQTGSFPLALVAPPYYQGADDHMRLLFKHIPSEEDARRLADNAYRYSFFMFRPIPYDQYISGVHTPIYQQGFLLLEDQSQVLTSPRLAVFFTLLAIGSLLSPSLPRKNMEAERFHQLGRAALMRSRLVEDPTIEGIQALFLMTLYMSLYDTAAANTSNIRWSMSGLIMKLLQTMGLQSDPDKFTLTPGENKRRRMLFGELFVYDIGQAFAFSRPPAIATGYYDVRPYMDEATTPESDFHCWKFKFASDCLGPIHSQAYSAAPPNFLTVSAMTKRIESYPMWDPPHVAGDRDRSDYADRLMQRHFARVTKQEVILYLHRPFFARAVVNHKDSPLQSAYGLSVIAAYRAAHSIVSFIHQLYSQVQHPVDRVWFLWANIFGAVVVLGSLVIQCPQVTFAKDAYDQCRLACELFAKVKDGFGAEKVYDKMVVLRDLAHQSLSDYLSNDPSTSPATRRLKAPQETEDLLSKYGAKTRTIARTDTSGSSGNGSMLGTPSEHSSPGRAEPVVPLPLHQASAGTFHPRVIEYIRDMPAQSVDVRGFDLNQVQPSWSQHSGHSTQSASSSRGFTLPPIQEGGPPSSLVQDSITPRHHHHMQLDQYGPPSNSGQAQMGPPHAPHNRQDTASTVGSSTGSEYGGPGPSFQNASFSQGNYAQYDHNGYATSSSNVPATSQHTAHIHHQPPSHYQQQHPQHPQPSAAYPIQYQNQGAYMPPHGPATTQHQPMYQGFPPNNAPLHNQAHTTHPTHVQQPPLTHLQHQQPHQTLPPIQTMQSHPNFAQTYQHPQQPQPQQYREDAQRHTMEPWHNLMAQIYPPQQ